jgi:hypothetical protein
MGDPNDKKDRCPLMVHIDKDHGWDSWEPEKSIGDDKVVKHSLQWKRSFIWIFIRDYFLLFRRQIACFVEFINDSLSFVDLFRNISKKFKLLNGLIQQFITILSFLPGSNFNVLVLSHILLFQSTPHLTFTKLSLILFNWLIFSLHCSS